MPRIIEPGHKLYCQADENLRKITDLAGDPVTQVNRKRYEVKVEPALEERFKEVLIEFHEKHNGDYGLMLILGYDPIFENLFKMDFKKDLIGGKTNLRNDYKTIENAILRVVKDEKHNDCCYVIDTKGNMYSGYKVDVPNGGVFRAFDTDINNIRLTLFGDKYIGGTRFEAGIAVAHLIVGSQVGMVREGNGIYVVENKNGLIRIPYYIGAETPPLEGAVLDTNLRPQKESSIIHPPRTLCNTLIN